MARFQLAESCHFIVIGILTLRHAFTIVGWNTEFLHVGIQRLPGYFQHFRRFFLMSIADVNGRFDSVPFILILSNWI